MANLHIQHNKPKSHVPKQEVISQRKFGVHIWNIKTLPHYVSLTTQLLSDIGAVEHNKLSNRQPNWISNKTLKKLTLNDILVPVCNQEASIDFCSLHFIVLHFSSLNNRWLLFEYVLWYIIWDSTLKASTATPSLYVILLLLVIVGNLKLGG